ncbi:MAG: ATP-binding protein, partial [Limnobacter sp.]|nr:ATP-binding protein [Limnobacter sp.]
GQFADCVVQKPLAGELGQFSSLTQVKAVIDPVSIAQLSQRANTLAQNLGFDESSLYSLELVLAESLTNIMRHGYSNQRPAPTELFFVCFDNAIAIVIRDTGSRIPDRVLQQLKPDMSYMDDLAVSDLPEGGMGLTFMAMVSTCFRYICDGQANELTLLISKQPQG